MKCIETAFNWHGGISSALYSFAFTRRIRSEHHRDDILDEIDKCIDIVMHQEQTDPEGNNISDLRSMMLVVEMLQVGIKLPDPYKE